MPDPGPQTAAEFWPFLRAWKADADDATAELMDAIVAAAESANELLKARARAYTQAKVQATKATIPELNALVDLETANDHLRADLADGRKMAAKLRHEAVMAWGSKLQSQMGLAKREAELAKWEPSEVAS